MRQGINVDAIRHPPKRIGCNIPIQIKIHSNPPKKKLNAKDIYVELRTNHLDQSLTFIIIYI